MRIASIGCLILGLTFGGQRLEAFQEAEKERSQEEIRQEVWDGLDDQAQQWATEMKNSLSEGSEGRAMLETILLGQRMGSEDGWFALAKPQSAYQWKDMLERYDVDSNQKISREEFSGSQADFVALDRSGDGQWDQADWDWPQSRGSDAFGDWVNRADQDSDGVISADERQRIAERLAGEESLTLEQFRRLFEPPRPVRKREGPTPNHLVKGLYRQEIGAHHPGPMLGEQAPDFQLKDVDGQTHQLKDYVSEKPVVLIFGNFTCGPFRSQAGNVRDLIERYSNRVNILMVYVREAHPSDGWNMVRNRKEGIEILQPKTYSERHDVAVQCARHFDAPVPLLVDDVDDRVGKLYSGMPSRLYLIDQQQRVVYKSGRGPHFFWPSDLENALVAFLNDSEKDEPVKTSTP